MPKIALVGQGYSLRSPTAGAQAAINVYPEVFQDPNNKTENIAFLYGIPGRHVFSNPGLSGVVRGIWTGGGRCFVAIGTQYCELNSSGAIIYGPYTISNATVFGFANSPVQFFANGTQLFIVSGGVAYIDSGSGPVVVSQSDATGFVNVFGTGVGWVSGDKFVDDGSWVGKTIIINGVNYTISGIGSGGFGPPNPPTQTQLYTTSAAGIQTGVAYSVAGSQFPFAAVTGAFLDDSFWFNIPFTRIAKFSNVNNGALWNGLDFITKNSWPDHIMSILADASQMYLWGDQSFEVWQANPGSTTNFFTRIDGASSRIGSISPWGPISIEGHVYFIGSGDQGRPTAYILNGFTPTRISQHGQEEVWYANNFGPGCISYTYTEEGHTFWCINFGAQTWCFDTTTGAWHQRMAGPFTAFTPYPTAYHSYIPEFGNGKHLTGGPLDGVIYESSSKFYDDAGSNIAWQRALPAQYNNGMRLYDRRLEILMETGTTPSGTPTVLLDISDDRGHTFSSVGTASIGVAGDYQARVFWPGLGSYFERVYRLSGSSQGRVALIDAELDQELGTV